MVQLFVHAQLHEKRELILLELQGRLATAANQSRNSLRVGELNIEPNSVATIQIGYHRLEGKVMPLKKPLAILERITTSTDSHVTSPASTNINDNTTPNYRVIDILRHKIIFNTRPEPVGLLE